MQIHLSSIILCLYMYMKKIIIATAHPGKSEAAHLETHGNPAKSICSC